MSSVIKIADSLVDQYLGSLTNVLIPEICAKSNIKIPEGKSQPEGFWTHSYIIGFFTSYIALYSQTLNLTQDFGIGRAFDDEDKSKIMNRVLDRICPDDKEQFMLKNLEIDKKLKETGDPSTAYDEDYTKANSDVTKAWCLFHEEAPIKLKQLLNMPEITPELLDEPEVKMAYEHALREVSSASGDPLSFYAKMGLMLSDIYIKEHIYLQYIKK